MPPRCTTGSPTACARCWRAASPRCPLISGRCSAVSCSATTAMALLSPRMTSAGRGSRTCWPCPGQNVAFVLLVVQPLVVRFGLWARWLAILGVLALFATVTRFEPSVLRATVMAAIAVTVWLAGRQASGRRLLALAVAALLLWQPLLVHSLAFRLSVAASAGILFWASRLAARRRRAAAAGTSTGRHRRGAACGCAVDRSDLRRGSGGGGAGQPAGGSGGRRGDDVGPDGWTPGRPGRRGSGRRPASAHPWTSGLDRSGGRELHRPAPRLPRHGSRRRAGRRSDGGLLRASAARRRARSPGW